MKQHARVVVIGGGIIGCSVLYHLTRLGWTEVALIEKNELTAGSSWHAAGLVTFFAESPFFIRIQKESLDIFEALEAEHGTPTGVHRCGGLRLIRGRDELLQYQRYCAMARTLGVECDVIAPDATRELFPLLEDAGFQGALHVADDGWVDPSQSTHALANAARGAGASIHRHTRVLSMRQASGGEWRVTTDQGDITCDILVNCAGFWGAEISAMLGHRLPVVPMEHEYLVTDSVPGLAERNIELPVLRDYSVPFYVRQERDGLLVSCYESAPKFFAIDGIPPEFGQELLPPDLDRAAPQLAATQAAVPALQEVGIKTVINGPTGKSPDLKPLVGPAHGIRNYFVLCGFSGGFLHSSLARYLAAWIVDGDPGIDLAAVDVRRFGRYANRAYTYERLGSHHGFAYAVYYPHPEQPSGREARTSPIHDRLAAQGAVFGVRNGWEVPNWFAAPGEAAEDQPSFQWPNWAQAVGEECGITQRGIGIADISSLAKFEVTGPGAAAWLDAMTSNRIPRHDGAIGVCPMLTPTGGVAAWFMLTRWAADHFYLTSGAPSEQQDEDWLRWHLPGDGVQVRNVSDERGALALVGPGSKDLLSTLTGNGIDGGPLPRARAAPAAAGFSPAAAGFGPAAAGFPVAAGFGDVWLLNTSGSMGDRFELHAPVAGLPGAYEHVLAKAVEGDITNIGMRALHALRMEARVPAFGAELSPQTNILAAGLERWVRMEKRDFIGRDALATASEQDRERKLVWLGLDNDRGKRDLLVWGGEPVLQDDEVVGTIASAACGHTPGRQLASAWLDARAVPGGGPLEVDVFGERQTANLR